MMASEAELLRTLPPTERDELINKLSEKQAAALMFDWGFWARPSQLPPEGKWRTWLLKSGRGFGKTRSGAEFVRSMIESGRAKYVALVAPTAADARDVMAEGESGLMNICPPWNRPTYEPSKRRITWPNGARATLYSADEPDRLRGPQHDLAWCDEVSSWRYPEAWDMLMFGLRLGDDPRVVVTTTPKPNKITKDLVKDPNTIITSGSTYENRANLAPAFLEQIVAKYEGTRLGRQELYGELLSDVEGALWSWDLIEASRSKAPKQYRRIVVAIDPAVTSEEGSDETGIIVAGIDQAGVGYIIEDLSTKASPNEWAKRAIEAYHRHKADRIVAEVNQGGDMVESIIRHLDHGISYKAVHAAKGKYVRAEPVAALYEQQKVKHIGAFPALEDQLCNWVQGESSPDRLDALVWAITELMLETYSTAGPRLVSFNRKW
jgi:phage terminase large subunit-like protein